MTIYINHIAVEIEERFTIQQLLSLQNIKAEKGIAIAINNNVILKLNWETHTLYENDKVTIIRATQGG